MTHSPVLLILDALAVYRLTRLISADTITARLRERLIGTMLGETRDLAGHRPRVARRPRVAEFITCPWCTSPYLAAAVTACQALAPHVWIYAASVLAFSAVAGALSEHV